LIQQISDFVLTSLYLEKVSRGSQFKLDLTHGKVDHGRVKDLCNVEVLSLGSIKCVSYGKVRNVLVTNPVGSVWGLRKDGTTGSHTDLGRKELDR
jgi:hypothetical protein